MIQSFMFYIQLCKGQAIYMVYLKKLIVSHLVIKFHGFTESAS